MAIVKKLKQHPPLPPSRYEVGIYCRVSTESKTQIVSIGHQLSGLIADVANSYQARLYDVYLDIQSGRTSDNRKNLMRLLDDCRAGRVTLVYTKSISRFARNTVDVLTIIRELKKMNVPVYFENEQLYSFDKEAELAISLHGAIAQGESESKSENIKWSLDRAAQNPDAQIYNRKCYGYSNAEDGSLVINEQEAEVIRQVFQMYLDGYSVGGIKKYLEENSILTSRGKSTWSKRSIGTILVNEKYIGDVILYKTFSPNFPEKKRIQNNGEHKKNLQEDHHPAIISREMFRAVQEMRESRSNIERHAEAKNKETIDKVSKAIDKFKRKNKPINFETVSKEAGVSRATLYNNAQVKERILSLRAISKASPLDDVVAVKKDKMQLKDDKIATLREQVKKLEDDKKKLIVQLVDYEELKSENERLKKQLTKK